MSALADWAARVQAVAARAEGELAITVVREQAREFVSIERAVTPKRSGKLAGSEWIDSIGGGGAFASAMVSPHIKYAEFRNDGGTITAADEPARSGRRHKSGKPYRHSLAWPGGFAMHVTQAGSHYVQRAEAAAPGRLTGVAEGVVADFFEGI
jgi:hypothetical protein